MVETLDMALKFIEHHPGDAARVLEFLPPAKSSEFLASIEETFVVRIASHLAPDYLATCVPHLNLDIKIHIFKSLETQTAVDIFRYLNNKEKIRLLRHLPLSKRVAIQTLNKYNQNSVGAWMSTDHFFVAQEKIIEEVIELIHESEQTNHDYIFLVNNKRQFVSIVNTSQLLKTDVKLPISSIKTFSTSSLSARTSVQDVVNHDAWRHFTMLPVVELDNRLVGVLTYNDLIMAIENIQSEFASRNTRMGDEMFELVWTFFNNFIRLLNDFFAVLAQKR